MILVVVSWDNPFQYPGRTPNPMGISDTLGNTYNTVIFNDASNTYKQISAVYYAINKAASNSLILTLDCDKCRMVASTTGDGGNLVSYKAITLLKGATAIDTIDMYETDQDTDFDEITQSQSMTSDDSKLILVGLPKNLQLDLQFDAFGFLNGTEHPDFDRPADNGWVYARMSTIFDSIGQKNTVRLNYPKIKTVPRRFYLISVK
jgi:hypothetical protein